ncbi:SLBB domain-containing protein [Novosphingobium sp. B 225]|uniref:SLBB domain-containing protein n=1 Tax=Novosphingobium sp. B 225 TaxID=1961849 RepID=UPI000B4B7F88|nr:SLBB domain-containing protein [Novosphingobium sp. B 225]
MSTYKLFGRAALSLCGACLLATGIIANNAAFAQSIPSGSPVPLPTGATDGEATSRDTENASDISPVASSVFQPTALGPNGGDKQPPIEERARDQDNVLSRKLLLRDPPKPGEFENFVNGVADHPVPRYGTDLLLPASRDFAVPATATVPPEYRLNVGDTVILYLTGSVGGTVEREIDSNGNIFLPSVGSIRLAGVLYRDLRTKVIGAIGREYRYFDVSVAIKSLRGIRVYVTGFANNPGAFNVGSLSTLVNAVMQAGGPSAGGSFRSVKLYRNGREVADFDLYKLLRGGSRVGDEVLHNEDVLFIPAAGEQVAVLGSVQDEAIYELKPGETLAQALALAGGPNVLGDPDRTMLYRTSDLNGRGPIEVPRAEASSYVAKGGDILHILSRGSLVQPVVRQSVLVRVEGEVNRPGNYYVGPNTPLSTVLDMAGGVTERGYVFGSRLVRQSVREQQRASFGEAVEQLEFSLASAPLATSNSVSDSRIAAEMASAKEVLALLRKREPDGRVVMKMEPGAATLPGDLLLERNDHLIVPTRPTTVGVFGAVFRPGSFLIDGQPMLLKDYIGRAGGLQNVGDSKRIFVVRANGDVVTRKGGLMKTRALPGDVVFVPLRTTKSDIWQRIRDITSVIFQLGVTAAAVNSIN